ncbi:sulfite exporter TauE/SafE family protein [Corynebacterium uropygiale]|uniref:Probable membrane transporter protein n=1 Tax=Corynebacterium uropygiale TaxID=1775911 RepID=A0A9X1QQ99_9CORY|nr:sulfite exporter TauE/SafE family protein [Corynebacterium uropygiale]MCF4005843.1 sulfite exporter TauE/SafE family protein [Corynebacterium uropygiale]
MPVLTIAVILVIAVFVGALVQRVTGLGVGMVTGPILTVLLGPLSGVVMVNALSMVNAANNAWAVRRETHWKRFGILAGSLLLGSLPALWVVHSLNGPWLLVAVGGLVLAAILFATFNPAGPIFRPDQLLPMVLAGVFAGFMSTVAGIAGPGLTAYARLTGWDYRQFVATLHPILLVANTLSFLLKAVVLGGFDVGVVPLWLWIIALVMLFAGAWGGDRLNHRISSTGARRLATILAVVGSSIVLVQGVLGLAR